MQVVGTYVIVALQNGIASMIPDRDFGMIFARSRILPDRERATSACASPVFGLALPIVGLLRNALLPGMIGFLSASIDRF